MINAILIENQCVQKKSLKETLAQYAPSIQLVKHASGFKDVLNYLNDSDVIFYDLSLREWEQSISYLDQFNQPNKLVGFSPSKADAYKAYKIKAVDFLLTPCVQKDVLGLINRLSPKAPEKKVYDELIGIPTIDGFEFFSSKEIIRCEGYQNCTRIITEKRPDIISSYNIGVFRKKLEEHSFFSPHKSHLINIHHIRKYHKEGSLHLSDESVVPVSKRRKPVFLKLMSLSR